MTCDPFPRCLGCGSSMLDDDADYCEGTDCEEKHLLRQMRRAVFFLNLRSTCRHYWRRVRDRVRGRA